MNPVEPVYITGLACRFPGIASPRALWRQWLNPPSTDVSAAWTVRHRRDARDADRVVEDALQDADIDLDDGGQALIRLFQAGEIHGSLISDTWPASALSRHPDPPEAWLEALSWLHTNTAGSALVLGEDVLSGAPGLVTLVLQGAEGLRPGNSAYAACAGAVAERSGGGKAADLLHRLTAETAIPLDRVGLLHAPLPLARQTAALFRRAAGAQGTRPLTPWLRAASGKTGLLALLHSLLSLTAGIIPPDPGDGGTPEPGVAFPFFRSTSPRPWFQDPGQPRRALALFPTWAVLLEEPGPSADVRAARFHDGLDWDNELVVLDAASLPDLAARTERLIVAIDDAAGAWTLQDLACRLQARRRPRLPVRLALISGDLGELRSTLEWVAERLARGEDPATDNENVYLSPGAGKMPGKLAFVFQGLMLEPLGESYADCLREWCLHFPEVRQVLDRVELRNRLPEDPVPTSQLFFPPEGLPPEARTQALGRLELPRGDAGWQGPDERNLAPFAVLVGNGIAWALFRMLGMPADFFWGQSAGEASGLVAAQAMKFDAVAAVYLANPEDEQRYYREGRLLMTISASDRIPEPPEGVDLAMVLSFGVRIFGGPAEDLEVLAAEFQEQGHMAQLLPFAAIHTPVFLPLRPFVRRLLQEVPVARSAGTVYSSQTSEPYPADADGIRERFASVIDQPVYVPATARALYRDGARVFVEVSDNGMCKDALGPERPAGVLSLRHPLRSPLSQLNHLCAALYTAGFDPALDVLHRARPPKPIDLALEPRRSPAPAPGMPFIGEIVAYVPGRELEMHRELDLSEDLYLRDHLLAGAPGVKPARASLPVMPMAIGMEMMAEAAACLAPGRGLIGFEGIRAAQWLRPRGGLSGRLHLRARTLDGEDGGRLCRIEVTVRSGRQRQPSLKGTVLFARRYRQTLGLEYEPPRGEIPYPCADDAFYRERLLFHGPRFQAVRGIRCCADNALVGDLEVLPTGRLFASRPEPALLTAPQVLDGLAQLFAFWAIPQQAFGFPVAIGHVEFYRPTPATGTRIPVYLRIVGKGLRTFTADLEVQDGNGRVWMRVQGWQIWMFRETERFIRAWRFPARNRLSDALHLRRTAARTAAMEIAVERKGAFETALIAHNYLAPEEMEIFDSFEERNPKRLPWLFGRVAAKDAVRQWLADAGIAGELHPAAVTLRNDARGGPFVAANEAVPTPPYLSISHSGDRAVALVAATPAGIDIESVAARGRGFAQTAFSDHERALLARFDDGETAAWETRFWSAKEAAGKIAGSGLQSLRKVRVETVDEQGLLSVSADGGRVFSVATELRDGWALAYGLDLMLTDSVEIIFHS